MDETTGLARAEWELTHDGAHRSNFNSHEALCVHCSRRFQEETCSTASPSFPRKCGRRANHPRTISVTHALWSVATHFRIFSDSLSHTNPNRFPQSISQPPLLSHQKFPPLTHSQSRSRVLKPSAHGVGWSCREWSWWGASWGECLSHHQKTAATQQQSTAASRDPPNLSLAFKLN